MSGDTTLVVESPIRYAAWLTSGEIPNCINIGTKIGAIIAHFAESAAITISIRADNKIKITKIGTTPISSFSNKLAPLTAITVPKFE